MNPMLRVQLTFLLLLITRAIPQIQDNYLYFSHLTTEDGLSNERVQCILQDQKGFMWFGTDDGLNKFDGYKFTVYSNDSTVSPYLTDRHIFSLCEDRFARLWIGTWDGLNMFDLKKHRIFHFRHKPDDPNSLAGDWINCIYEDSRGNIWIGTKDDGLSFLDHSCLSADKFDSNLTFVNYSYNPDDTTSLSVNNINSICEDSLGYIWIGTQGAGLNRFDPESKTFKRFRYLEYKGIFNPLIRKIWREPGSESNKLWIATQHNFMEFDATSFKTTKYHYNRYIHDGFVTIQKMNEHTFWLGSTGQGIYVFDKKKGNLVRLRGSPSNPGRLNHTWINEIYKDKCGRMWIATFGGIYKYDRFAHKFPLYQIEVESPEGKRTCNIFDIIEDRNPESSTIWIATPENGIIRFSRKTGEAESVAGQGTKIRYHCLLQDPDQPEIIWTATWGAALIKANQITGDAQQYLFHGDFRKLDPNSRNTFFNNSISRQVIKGSKGHIWLGSGGGFFKINPQTKDFVVYLPDDKNPESISSKDITPILEDRFGKIWVGTFGNGLNCLDPETERFIHYKYNPDNECSLDQNYIGALYEDKSGTLWVGTGQILHKFHREQNCFIRFKKFPGSIRGILEDDHGNLWISTGKGLSKFNPASNILRNYNINDGLQDNRFNIRSVHKSKDGELFFGGPKGFNAFYPDDIIDNPNAPEVVLTDFQIFNKSILPGKDSPFALAISETKEIILNNDQFVFSFEFSALNFSAPLKNQFAYKMEGIDPDWVYTDSKRRFVTYMQLLPGNMFLR